MTDQTVHDNPSWTHLCEKLRHIPAIDEAGLAQIAQIYEEREYLDAYSQHTDLRVAADPQAAAGGMWEAMGQLQFAFLVNRGLHPHHKMLDIGCGTLRGGRHFIKYLIPGNYCGMDISPKAIAYAKHYVFENGLSDKRPHLFVNELKNLRFRELSGETFDYILAQSVFTHLKSEHIEECHENLGTIMNVDSFFYFTYHEGTEYNQIGLKDFCYPYYFFESMAVKYGFKLKDYSSEYKHPIGQRMVELRKI